MKNNRYILLLILSSILLYTSSCTNDMNVNKKKDVHLVDKQDLYKQDKIDSVKEIFVTVLPPDSYQSEYTYTLDELNASTEFTGNKDIKVKIIFQEGKDGSPQPGYFGYGLTSANATMEQKGQSSRNAKQKSYKIRLYEDGGLWDGFEEINLNKSPYDTIRIRNKLSYDYLKLINNITSLQAQFVHLYVKDLSEGDYNVDYKDFGLFTQIEDVDKNYLKRRELDPNGSLYKAEYFEFYRYADKIKLKSDPNYNEENFEKILAIKGNDNHEKLIQMLDDVNNRLIHINDVIDKHFDRDNYITWLAFNILIDNIDTSSRNFCLYSPRDSNKWYFIPWDYDGGWNIRSFSNSNKAQWWQGISTYWGVPLHRRFFENDNNIKELSEKIESLSQTLNEEKTKEFLDAYRPKIEYFISREPDSRYLHVSLEEAMSEYEMIPNVVKESKERYYKSLENPMPVFMGDPRRIGDYHVFSWTESYDLQGDNIKYCIQISDSITFDRILYSKDDILDIEHVVSGLQPGKYFWKLEIVDSQGNKQTAFDYYLDNDNIKRFGIKEFIIH